MRPRILAAAAALWLTSCGYIGDPLPPLANVPSAVEDLAAIQRGVSIIAQFTVPQLTTEAKPIPLPLTIDLRIGPHAADHFDVNEWASTARHIVTPEITGPLATYKIPSAEWTGKEVLIAVRITAANGKQNNWSNVVILPVIAPPATPQSVNAAATAQGVRLTWSAPGNRFRILRKTGDTEYATVATVDKPEWTDTSAEFGRPYAFEVQTLVPVNDKKEAESELSAAVAITPADTFPPGAPAGLHADAAPGSIELAWDRNQEADLAGYRVYRAIAEGTFEKLADASLAPSYSDRALEHGKTYRYELSAVDRAGNESARSAAVEITFP